MEITPVQAAGAAVTAQLNLDVQNANVQQQQISRLPLSQILLGAVAGNDKNGNTIIRLAGNDLLLSSPVALAKNAQVALKIENVSGSIVAQLLSVDGKLPATQPQKVLYQQQQSTQNQTASLPNPQSNNQNNVQNLTLRIISVMPQGAGKIAEPINFPSNASIIADTVQLSSPGAAPLSAIVIAPLPEVMQNIRTKLSLKDENINSNPELEESLPGEIKPGTNLKVRINSTEPPTQQPAQPQIATENKTLGKQDWMSQPKTTETENLQTLVQNFKPELKVANNGNIALTGIVLHSEQNGEVLLQTSLGKVLVNGGVKYSTLEKGTILNLEISQISAPVEDSNISADDDSLLTTLTKKWPAFEALSQHGGSANTQLIKNLAGLDSSFASRLDGFVNAVKSGNVKDWLGTNYYDTLETSDDGKSIISKLKSDMGALRENFATPNPAGWQTMLFPIFDGQQLHQARLHVKYLPDEDNVPTPKAGTRFLVEIDTSHFGEIQMDGLVRNNIAKHFDLMIRTHDPLDLMIKQDIHQIFTDAGEVTGFKGNIEFSVAREFPNNIIEQLREQAVSTKIDHNGIEA